MAKDLKAKFDVFAMRSLKIDRLLVLWEKDAEDLVDALPPGTRAVWDGNRHRNRARNRTVSEDPAPPSALALRPRRGSVPVTCNGD